MTWQVKGVCASGRYSPEVWFPVGSSGPAVTQREYAKSLCRGCPVQGSCLQWALATGQEHGVWGGLDEQQRRDLHKQRQHQPVPA